MKLYQELASYIDARLTCLKRYLPPQHSAAPPWSVRHEQRIDKLVYDHMPNGAGVDSGVSICLESSTGESLVFIVPYHTMNEQGVYDEWVTFKVTVTASLMSGLNLEIEADVHDSESEPTLDLEDHIVDTIRDALEKDV